MLEKKGKRNQNNKKGHLLKITNMHIRYINKKNAWEDMQTEEKIHLYYTQLRVIT